MRLNGDVGRPIMGFSDRGAVAQLPRGLLRSRFYHQHRPGTRRLGRRLGVGVIVRSAMKLHGGGMDVVGEGGGTLFALMFPADG